MATVEVPLKELGRVLGAEVERQLPQLKEATRNGLLKSIPDLVEKSPVDTGLYASSWQFTETEKTMILGNSAPHAAVIEYGARPFTPPITPLLQWAKRVLGDPSQPPDYSPEVRSLAYGVRDKIRREGMKPRRVLQNAFPDIIQNIKEEWEKLG